MKSYKIFKYIIKGYFLAVLLLTLPSCDDDFLNEVPKDFLTPGNAYLDTDGFLSAITSLHHEARRIWMGADGANYFILFGLGSDFAGFGENFDNGPRMDYSVLTSSDGWSATVWRDMYAIIKDANTVISRAENPDVVWDRATRKNEVIAEARFMRAYAYRILAHAYGGVPILEEELTSPRADLTRATRHDTYQFIIQDLIYGATNLPDDEEQPGRITKAAANHLLAEIYLSVEQWTDAIAAASAVIDDPDYSLMEARFGSRSGEPGDVYWDLFRRGNQNRNEGNTETIWAIQLEFETPGGGGDEGARGLHVERAWGARYHSLKDPDGVNGFELSDLYGRPVGWCVTTDYLGYQIWDIDQDGNYDVDMRNSVHNIHRVDRGQFIYNNPASAYFGQAADLATVQTQAPRFWHPFFMKNTSPNNHPNGVINTGRIYRDQYAMRLAETYLLRAEAHLGNGDPTSAAADINVVRNRANATPVAPADVDISYILDERARELSMEEYRTLTLHRLGLQYERTRDYNPLWSGRTIQPHHNLWPIPQGEIDLNTGAELKQNTGYFSN